MTKRGITAAMVALVVSLGVGQEAAARGQPKGFIQNADGDQCWYRQVTMKDDTRLFKTLTANTSVLAFDEPGCMWGDAARLDINKTMINNVISRWYSHSDAAFMTRARDLRPARPEQARGVCIQSEKYPMIGIAVEYVGEGTIEQVYHTAQVVGCDL